MGDGDFWQPFLALLSHVADTGFAGADVTTYVECLADADALAAALSLP